MKHSATSLLDVPGNVTVVRDPDGDALARITDYTERWSYTYDHSGVHPIINKGLPVRVLDKYGPFTWEEPS